MVAGKMECARQCIGLQRTMYIKAVRDCRKMFTAENCTHFGYDYEVVTNKGLGEVEFWRGIGGILNFTVIEGHFRKMKTFFFSFVCLFVDTNPQVSHYDGKTDI